MNIDFKNFKEKQIKFSKSFEEIVKKHNISTPEMIVYLIDFLAYTCARSDLQELAREEFHKAFDESFERFKQKGNQAGE